MNAPAPPEPRRASALAAPAVQIGAEAAAFALMALAASGYLVVVQREEIAREFAIGWLHDKGVEADFDVERIDADGFTGRMSVGSGKNRVFEADRVEVAYDLTAPWTGGPLKVGVRAIRVVRPKLRVTFDGRKFSAGELDPLISDFLKRPKTDEPGPAVLIEDGLATIVTRNGDVRVAANAALDDGKLLRLDGRLLKTRLKAKDLDFATPGGTIRLRKVGTNLDADVRLKVSDLTTSSLDLDAGSAAIEGTIPYPDPKTQSLAGPARLRAAIATDRAKAGEAVASRFAANATVSGVLVGTPATVRLAGRMNGSASMASLTAGETKAQGLRAVFASNGLSAGRTSTAFPFTARVTARSLTAQGYTLEAASVDAGGRFRADKGGYLLTADGSAQGDSGLPAARARRIAHAVPVISGDPAQERAIAAALQRFRAHTTRVSFSARNGDMSLALTGPVRLDARSGGQVTFTPHGRFSVLGGKPGGFDLATRGGGLPEMQASISSWAYRSGSLDATLRLKASLNAPPAQKVVLDAPGRLRMRGGGTTFDLTGCGAVSAALVDFGETDLSDLSARVCPSGGPLIVASGGTWRVLGRFENGRGNIPVWLVAATDASGQFDVTGSGEMDRAAIKVAAARLADTTEVARFNPLRVSGGVNLAGGVWQGAFPISTDANRPVGTFNLTHNVASGEGEGRIDATNLVFAKDGLQPVEVLPVAEIIRDAEGPAAFTGTLRWGPAGVTSEGAFSTEGLNFSSPAGRITGLKTTTVLTSLTPIITAPDQTLTIDTVDAIVPLSQVAATYDVSGETLFLDAMKATVAKGEVDLEPLSIAFAEGRTVTGILNIHRIDIGEIVEGTSLGDRISVKAVVDGRLPFSMGPDGLRFREGHLVAVEPGRISISRTVLSNVKSEAEEAPPNPMDATTPTAPPHPMDATPVSANPMDATKPEEEFNAVQDFAYQAMENLSFTVLEAKVNSIDNGRLAVLFKIEGFHDPAVAEEARVSVQEAISGNAFKRRIPLPKGTPVNLTLDTSLNFDELIAAWRRGWVDAAE
jgi:hypothetical protein